MSEARSQPFGKTPSVSDQWKAEVIAALEACEPHPPDPFAAVESSPVVMATLDRFNHFSQETQQAVDDALCALVTQIANDHFASAAWLYVYRDDGLHAVFAHKSRDRDEFMPLDGPGMVTHVAQTKIALAAADVNKEPAYKKTLEDTKSAISVPLLTYDGQILGVFHLESSELDEYQYHDIPRLTVEGARLVPYLQMLRALERDDDRWFPWQSFSLQAQLFRLCNDVRRALDRTGIQCTIWTMNHDATHMLAYTTTGHAHEYMSDEELRLESYNGNLVALPPDAMATVRPNERTRIILRTSTGCEVKEGTYPCLEEKLKHRYLKWRMSAGVPVYARSPGEDTARPRCTFVLSCYDEDGEAILPSHDEFTMVADLIGDFITGFFALREELALTYLDQALKACRRPTDAFRAIKEKLIEFFSLDAIAIDGFLEGSETPWPITKGGNDRALWQRAARTRPLVKFLHLDVVDPTESRLGTVHLARRRPFTASERSLAERLLVHCVSVFRKWRVDGDVVMPREQSAFIS